MIKTNKILLINGPGVGFGEKYSSSHPSHPSIGIDVCEVITYLIHHYIGRLPASSAIYKKFIGRLPASSAIYKKYIGRLPAYSAIYKKYIGRLAASIGRLPASSAIYKKFIGRLPASSAIYKKFIGRLAASSAIYKKFIGRLPASSAIYKKLPLVLSLRTLWCIVILPWQRWNGYDISCGLNICTQTYYSSVNFHTSLPGKMSDYYIVPNDAHQKLSLVARLTCWEYKYLYTHHSALSQVSPRKIINYSVLALYQGELTTIHPSQSLYNYYHKWAISPIVFKLLRHQI